MPAKFLFPVLAAVLAVAALSGCTSTSPATPAPAFTENAANTDAGFTLALPDTVSVLPEPSGAAQTAALPVEPAAAFAGPTSLAATAPAVMTTNAQPATAVAAVAMPVTGQTAATPGVQPVSYTVPQNPAVLAATDPAEGQSNAGARSEIERLIEKYSALYQVPVDLVRHVVNRESTFNPKAYNHGHWGLMQIKHATARGMGYDGPASGLFDAETNLKYAVKYLRGAWLVSGGNPKRADRLYQSGYYYDAKRKGMLGETGLGSDSLRRRMQPDA